MAFLSELNSEDCGCDNNYFSVINESPLLSGSQENNFDPTNNPNNVLNYNNSNSTNNSSNLNNNANNNILHNNNNKKMNNLNNSELQQILGNSNNMQNNMQNNNQISEQQIQNILNSIPNTNKRNSTQLPDIGTMRNNNEQIELTNQLNNVVNNSNANGNSFNHGETQNKYILTMFNYVIVLLVALAVNDLAKYYINRSIKFQNGTHMYYVYYSVGLVIVLYIISKYTNNL